jgi:hypothetical protein
MIEEDGRVPVLDIGALAKIRAGKIAVRGGVARFGPRSVTFEDGRSEPFDAVVLATGFKPDLRGLLPDAKGVLDALGRPLVSDRATAERGLHFVGAIASPTGQLRQIAPAPRASPQWRREDCGSNAPEPSRRRGGQRQRVQLPAHATLQRRIDQLVLLHPALTLEGGADHRRGVMIAVAGEVAHLDLGVGQRGADHRFDFGDLHRHHTVSSGAAAAMAASRRATMSFAGSEQGTVTPPDI